MKIVKGNIIDFCKSAKTPIFVPHVVNDANVMGSGVARALFEYDKNVKKYYHWWFEQPLKKDMIDTTGRAKLGECQFIRVNENVTIVNMVGQSDPGVSEYPFFDAQGKQQTFTIPPIRYQSLAQCMLNTLHQMQKENVKEIITVKFGSGLAGGDWVIIEDYIKVLWELNGIKVTIVEP